MLHRVPLEPKLFLFPPLPRCHTRPFSSSPGKPLSDFWERAAVLQSPLAAAAAAYTVGPPQRSDSDPLTHYQGV